MSLNRDFSLVVPPFELLDAKLAKKAKSAKKTTAKQFFASFAALRKLRAMQFLWPLLALAACGDIPPPYTPPANNHAHEHATNQPAANQKQDMPGHGTSDEPDFRWDYIKAPSPGHALVDLKNEKDPVTLKPVGASTAEYKGYLVHFESDATKAKFERKPIKFLSMLSLEPAVDGSVTLVDASSYQDAVTEFCPFMTESEVDPHGSVYLLHRGWKFYFCCWSGCGDYFIQDPAKVYDWYGLVERDGKLVKK